MKPNQSLLLNSVYFFYLESLHLQPLFGYLYQLQTGQSLFIVY